MLSRFSHDLLFVTPWTVACQAPLSIGFSRQEYWGELPFPSPHSKFILPPVLLPFGKHKFVFYVCESISVLYIYSLVGIFQIPHISLSRGTCLSLSDLFH